MDWFTVKDGRIDRVRETADDVSLADEWVRAGRDSDVPYCIGDKVEWFDKNFIRVSDKRLVELGLRVDDCGVWYRKDDWRTSWVVDELDVVVNRDEWTLDVPLAGVSSQRWAEESCGWIDTTPPPVKVIVATPPVVDSTANG